MAKKLLVADDSLTIQKVIKLALSNDGYEIQTVSDGNDAVQQISLFRPDVILIDVSLPGKSAFEVKAATNHQGDFENTRFILMSSAFEKVDEQLVQEVKFHGRLTKPFDPTHLRQVILEVLGQSAPQSSITSTSTPRPLPPLPSATPPSNFPPLPPLPSSTPPSTESLWEAQDGPMLDFPDLSPPPLPGAARSAPPPPELPPLPEISEFLSSPGESPPDSGSDDIKHLTESTVRMSGLDDFEWSINESAKKPAGLQFEPPAVESPNFDLSPEIEIQPSSFESRHETPPPSMSSQINPTQLEEMIVRQVQKTLEETLEKMAQKILPEVAERVIKQEIKKLLQDQA